MPNAVLDVDESGNGTMRFSILSELGRFGDPELILAIARRICELKPKTKDAVRMLRRWRTGAAKAGDALELANRIIATVNEYLKAHPSIEWADPA